MKKRGLYSVILLICIAMLGIIAVQFLWIRNAIRIKEAQFSQDVNEALQMTVGRLETRENVFMLSKDYQGDSLLNILQAFVLDTLETLAPRLDSMLTVEGFIPPPPPPAPPPSFIPAPPFLIAEPYIQAQYQYQYFIKNMEREQRIMDSLLRYYQKHHQFSEWNYPGELNEMIEYPEMIHIDTFIRSINGRNNVQYDIVVRNGNFVVKDKAGKKENLLPAGSKKTLRRQGSSVLDKQARQLDDQVRKINRKVKKVTDVIQKIAVELETQPKPVRERIDKETLYKVLRESMANKGIDLSFEYAVYSPANDSNPLPIRSDGFDPDKIPTEYRTSLFPNDIFKKQEELLVYFPGQKRHILASPSWLSIGSGLFTLIIVITSALSIIVMIRQKKVSDIKTDFINNMTHEFKTPLATISVAADSISNAKVLQDPEMIRNFTKIIKEENSRMNSRVEQVLQMALIDKKDFRLVPVRVDMHELIRNVVSLFRLQVEKRDGIIHLKLDAENPVLFADKDHIHNVLVNLLDNANKYSEKRPEILVYTLNRSDRFIFGVEDKGVGMNQETQRKIFDKFYRVTMGNIHNIKGFGLGLSYVRAIVLAHKGDILLSSHPGKGSRFEISLPLAKNL